MIIICILLSILLSLTVAFSIILYRLLQNLNKDFNGTQHIFFVLKKWDRREEQENFYLRKKMETLGYKRIAIYGCTIIGKRVARELRESDVEVVCFIDRNAANIQMNIPVLSDVEKMPNVDVIIITVVTQYYEIKNSIQNKINCPILFMEDIL